MDKEKFNIDSERGKIDALNELLELILEKMPDGISKDTGMVIRAGTRIGNLAQTIVEVAVDEDAKCGDAAKVHLIREQLETVLEILETFCAGNGIEVKK